ncbi:MAG: hypothetical protein LBC41_03460 [Clostridiales bacterium]|jgi:hypothetical protein|nr:hypothetical protein [Clostridiales bacterium]MDR2749698.1 hypothetical protein [Clostridiales bacterium]
MYLDPSMGGMLLQIIIAIVAAGGAIAFSFRRKIAKLFAKKTGDQGIKADFKLTSQDDVVDMIDKDQVNK